MTHIAAAVPTFKRQRKRPNCPAAAATAAVFKLFFEKGRDNGKQIPKSWDELLRQLQEGTIVPRSLHVSWLICTVHKGGSPRGELGVNALFINVRSSSGNKGSTFEHNIPLLWRAVRIERTHFRSVPLQRGASLLWEEIGVGMRPAQGEVKSVQCPRLIYRHGGNCCWPSEWGMRRRKWLFNKRLWQRWVSFLTGGLQLLIFYFPPDENVSHACALNQTITGEGRIKVVDLDLEKATFHTF